MKKWIIKVLLCAGFSLLLLSQAVTADDKSAAEEFIKSNLDAVFTVLQNKDLSQETRNSEVEKIVTPMFDFTLMGKLSLGKTYWPELSPDQRERFTELFVERLRRSYLNKLTAYTDEKIIYESPVAVKKKVHMPTLLISKGKKISMLYKLYPTNNSWKIYDVEIEGVSIIRSYRSQFNEILQKGTFDDLLQKMERPANN
ncbi:MAG: ABC transporter substrate-binding protein [Desulfobacteraceae bacterium]|nr:ABC transporter substrate-binding protein [Desulfobacteraceae bacterium]